MSEPLSLEFTADLFVKSVSVRRNSNQGGCTEAF